MHQKGEIIGGVSIPFKVIVKYDVMGNAEQVCTIHINKLFIVAHIVYFCNDSRKVFWRPRGLSHWT